MRKLIRIIVNCILMFIGTSSFYYVLRVPCSVLDGIKSAALALTAFSIITANIKASRGDWHKDSPWLVLGLGAELSLFLIILSTHSLISRLGLFVWAIFNLDYCLRFVSNILGKTVTVFNLKFRGE